MKVVKWVPWRGGMKETETQEAEDAIIEDIRAHGYVFSGWDHQNAETGCPMFEDGTVRTYSLRGWATLMAKAWNITDCEDEPVYMEFYMSVPEGMTKRLPSKESMAANVYVNIQDIQKRIEENAIAIASAATGVVTAAGGSYEDVKKAQDKLADLENEQKELTEQLLDVMLQGGKNSILKTLVTVTGARDVYFNALETWCTQKRVEFDQLKREAQMLHHSLCNMSHADQCGYFYEMNDDGTDDWQGLRHCSYLMSAYNLRTMGYSTTDFLNARYILTHDRMPQKESN